MLDRGRKATGGEGTPNRRRTAWPFGYRNLTPIVPGSCLLVHLFHRALLRAIETTNAKPSTEKSCSSNRVARTERLQLSILSSRSPRNFRAAAP
ncbi:MAG: hypothetical protein C4334_01045 [Pyrinomonas sp.]